MKVIAAVVLIFASGLAHADGWTGTDTLMLGASLGLKVVDWGQTRDIASRPQDYHENNRFLGEHPTSQQVDRYFALSIGATSAVAFILPQTYRRWFLGGVIVLDASAVMKNHQIGLRVNF